MPKGEKSSGKNGGERAAFSGSEVVVGMAAYQTWIYLSSSASESLSVNVPADGVVLTVHQVSMLAACLLYGFVIYRRGRVALALGDVRLMWVAGALMCAGSALYALPGVFSVPLVLIGAGFSGAAAGWLTVLLSVWFNRMAARRCVVCCALSFLLAVVLYQLLFDAAAILRAIACVLSPLLVCSTLSEAVNRAGKGAGERASRVATSISLRDLPWRMGAGLFVIMFVYGGARVLLDEPDLGLEPVERLLVLVAGVAVFAVWGALFSGLKADLRVAFRVAIPVLAVALLVPLIFSGAAAGYAVVLASGANVMLEAMIWVLLANAAVTTRTPAFLIFAVGRGAVSSGMICGQAFAVWASGTYGLFLVVSIVGLMEVMGSMFPNVNSMLIFETPTKAELGEMARRDNRGVEERVASIARDYGLTPRETEVFSMWVEGYSASYIERRLCVSLSTVKTHLHHIYGKCGVSSRSEVIDLLKGA